MENDRRTKGTSIRRLGVVAVSALSFIALAPGAQAGPNGTERPIAGTCDTAITPLSAPGAFPVVLAVASQCNLRHLGLTFGGTDEEIVVPVGPPVGTMLPVYISIQRVTYVAANGDELWSTFEGPGVIDFATGKATFNGTETFVGGTGRFHGATGTSHTAGEGSLVDNRGFLTVLGSISY